MSILSDNQIAERCGVVLMNHGYMQTAIEKPMINPFHPNSVKEVKGGDATGNMPYRALSFGLSSYGYDVRLTKDVKIFTNVNAGIADVKKLDPECYIDATVKVDEDGASYVILPANSFLLGVTEEYFVIPRDILVICLGKSSYARVGAIVNVTPLEPEWEGQVVIEISNTTPIPMKIYLHEGIAQFLFFKADDVCKISYADRQGKYQGQVGMTLPKV